MDVCCNIGDAINKIGFGLVVWNLARKRGAPPPAPQRIGAPEKVLDQG